MEIKNPFEKLYDQANELKVEQQCLTDDIIFGNLSTDAVERSNARLLEIKSELEELKDMEELLLKISQKSDEVYEKEPLTIFKKELPKKSYLIEKTVKCAYCDIISLLTNKVAYVINIYNDSKVEPICENCYQIKKEITLNKIKKQNAN